MAVEVTGFDHFSVVVSNTSKALTFYAGLLGLKIDKARPELGYPGAWLSIGQYQIHLLEVPNPDAVEGRPAHGGRDRHLALTVASLDQLVAALDEAGIAYTLSKSGRQALFCRDYDGNAVELIEKAQM